MQLTSMHLLTQVRERKQKVVDLSKRDCKVYRTDHICMSLTLQIFRWRSMRSVHMMNLTIIMRRYMMKIAEHFANQDNCLSLVTGESIGQVASQTMHSLYVTNEVCQMPVFRPCIGLDKNEIVKVAEKIGTYETSILTV